MKRSILGCDWRKLSSFTIMTAFVEWCLRGLGVLHGIASVAIHADSPYEFRNSSF